jgi:uncharacterized ferritin-like protein (DUF455 family)
MATSIGLVRGAAVTQSFQERRAKLCAYLYSLVRLLELEAAWLTLDANLESKLALGIAIGLAGEDIARLQARLRTLLSQEAVPACRAPYADSFDRAALLEDGRQRVGFAVSVLSDLSANMRAHVANEPFMGDQPSTCMLENILASLDRQLRELRPWADESAFLEPVAAPNGEDVRIYAAEEPLPTMLPMPVRPPNWVISSEPFTTHKSAADVLEMGEHTRRWLHRIATDVEIDAMELCCRNIVDFRAMPLDFKVDMARQVWDETRHALMLRRFLRRLGAELGDYPYSAAVWSKYMLGETLAERLAIEQVIQEGDAIEANIAFAELLVQAGHVDLAEVIDFANADEACHAYFGNKWLRYLTNDDADEYWSVLNGACAKLRRQLKPTESMHIEIRRLTGFPVDTTSDAGHPRSGGESDCHCSSSVATHS